MRSKGNIDRPLLIITLLLLGLGFLVFSSASLGLLAREGLNFSALAVSQLGLGLVGGTVLMLLVARIPVQQYRRATPVLFGIGLLVTLSVFIPGLGFESGGATRWIHLFGFSLQPAEILKLTTVLFLAHLLAQNNRLLHRYTKGLLPFLAVLVAVALVLLLQPDTGTFLVIALAAGTMFVVAGAKVRDLAILFLLLVLGLAILATVRPYVMDRILTFIDPTTDVLDSGYQLRQSLIAVGTGGFVGRGFGQSIQKFGYLPEPIGDSIYSVAAEEFGFVGSVILLLLFVAFGLRGLTLAARAPDRYSGLVVVGIVILIVSQSFLNIGSMIGVVPLTGLPLIFVSHGGTALLFALVGVGIVLSISRYCNKHS